MKRFIDDFKRYYKYAIYSGKAELKSGIASSHLSWLWWILDPLLFMLVYSFVSLVVFGKAEPYFSAFIFVGYNSYKYFEKGLKTSVKLVANNKSIVKKVYIPKHILLFSKIYVNLFESSIAFLLTFGTMVLYRVPLSYHMLDFIPLVILLVLLTFSFSTILMHFGVFVEDLANVINVTLRLLFYLSGVFYNLDKRIQDPLLRTLLVKGNPMAFIIAQMRNSLLYGKGIDWLFYTIWLTFSVIVSILGIRLIYKNENGYVKVI